MVSTKQLHFKGPYLRQNWSLPDSIIYSFTKNPSKSKAWQKLIQSCKYFFAKNAILVVDELNTGILNKKWNIVLYRVKNGEKTIFSNIINYKSVLYKIWLIEIMIDYRSQPSNLLSSIIPYFYRCDIKTSQICHQEITYDQFEFIFSKVEDIYLDNCVVRNKNDEIVPFEKLVKALPKVSKFLFDDNLIFSSITSKTTKGLFEFPHISKISQMRLYGIPETFDIEVFYSFIKKNKNTKFRIRFRDAISEACKTRIEAIVDEIIAVENHDYKIPNIDFDGLPNEKWGKIQSLIYQQNK